MTRTGASDRLARRWFWALLLVAVVAMGALYTALGARSRPVTGLVVFVSGVVLLAAATQAGRILLALERARRPEVPIANTQVNTPRAASRRRVTMGERLFGARAPSAPETRRRGP